MSITKTSLKRLVSHTDIKTLSDNSYHLLSKYIDKVLTNLINTIVIIVKQKGNNTVLPIDVCMYINKDF